MHEGQASMEQKSMGTLHVLLTRLFNIKF